ncbi:MAG: TRAP transporter large permease subunit [Xanthobacteraceae bacterium]|nr:TRAP transporter large permease subunit [Xanthobacteraceae bacterium]QYK45844.1 MAG: TRAP transporter large permease subunit [Xanthobacteraceae bacterium]
MTAFLIHNMAPIMFGTLVVCLLIGYPATFTLAAVGLFFGVIGIELGLFAPNFLQALPERVYGTMNNDTLLAIPFFTFMGLVLERSGMAEDLLDTIGQVFGPIRGGLAYAVIFVGALLAATTGVVAASVISMGLISLPIMLRYGYDRRLASGVIAASGTLAQIIPPSLVLIVMADQLGRSVGDMYEGAFIPGLVLSSLYAGYVFLVTMIFPHRAPGLPPEAQTLKEDGEKRPLRTATNFLGLTIAVPLLTFIMVALFLFVITAAVGGLFNTNAISNAIALPAPFGSYLTALDFIALAAAFYMLYRGVRNANFHTQPHANLALLAVVSGAVGVIIMRRFDSKGADFVVLSMFISIIFAFLVSIGDRWRGFAGVLGSLVAMVVAAYLFILDPVPVAPGYLAQFHVLLRALTAIGGGLAAFLAVGFVLGSVPVLRGPLLSEMSRQVTSVMVPPLALIFLVLGTIFIGLATPTEGGAMGAAGAVILAIMKGRLNFNLLKQATHSTAKLSAFVLFILIGARVFSLTFYGVDGHKWVEELLVSLPGGQIGFLIVVNAIVFILAFFLDFFELAFIVVPLLGPAAERLGIDLIWFGIILGVNMQTSFMHPPFGFALFYLRSVAPKESYVDRISGQMTAGVTTGQIYWGAVPFVVIQCIMVLLVILFPQMVLHYKGTATGIDPSKVKIEIQLPDDQPPLKLD